jgi:hypothetical protein
VPNLKETIGSIVQKLRNYRALYERNEMAVRQHIVNPILRALDWDPESPAEVVPNIYTEEGFPDYCLTIANNKKLFIEVKNLKVDIEEKNIISQLGKYAFNEGVKFSLLTNGVSWVLIRSFEEGAPLMKRIVWKVDLEEDNEGEVMRKLNTISKTNIGSAEFLIKKIQILDEIWQSLLNEPKDMVKSLIPTVKSFISQGYPEYQFNDTEIEDYLTQRIKEILPDQIEEEAMEATSEDTIRQEGPMYRFRLGNETFESPHAIDILINTANWLIQKGKLRPENCPVVIGGRKRYLINREPKHRFDDDFKNPKQLSNGLWIEVHHNKASCINYAKRLLEKFGFPPDTLTIVSII